MAQYSVTADKDIAVTTADRKQVLVRGGKVSIVSEEVAKHSFFVASGGVVLGAAADTDADNAKPVEEMGELKDAEAKGDAVAAAAVQEKIDSIRPWARSKKG